MRSGMLEKLLQTFLRAQFGDVGRKTRGALLEVAALGMVGLAVTLLFLGMFLWLSLRIEPWLAAVALAGFALLLAAILMLAGWVLLHRKKTDPQEQLISTLKALGLVQNEGLKGGESVEGKQGSGAAMVASALVAGLVLGHSVKR